MSKKPVVYQIYIPSFFDSNNDGVGDLNGIIEKIDYIKSLDIDYVWISPIFKSPMKDNGYDVEDFYQVNERYGKLEDVRKLLDVFHENGIKVILDIVFNHSSDKHKWFKRAVNGDEKYRDYYHFFDSDSTIVNKDLRSAFGQDAFTYLEEIDMYYFNSFSKYQPDLNWENQSLRNELRKIVNYWSDFGFDGFRLDVFDMIGKDYNILKNSNLIWDIAGNDKVKIWWEEVLSDLPPEKYVVSECNVEAKIAKKYTIDSKINSVFSFDHLDERSWNKNGFSKSRWLDKLFAKPIDVNNFGGDIAIALDNHDNPRVIDEFSGDTNDIAKLLLTISIFNNSSAFLYQGNEFGMRNPIFKSTSELVDIGSNNIDDPKILKYSRDNARTPIPWNKEEEFFGFSNAKPWLTEKHAREFVGNKELLAFMKKVLDIRNTYSFGDRKMKYVDGNVLKIKLTSKTDKVVLYLNKTENELRCPIESEEILLSHQYADNVLNKNGVIISLIKGEE